MKISANVTTQEECDSLIRLLEKAKEDMERRAKDIEPLLLASVPGDAMISTGDPQQTRCDSGKPHKGQVGQS